jgi:benzoate/toluate 1,2-dioxygenase reductase subunit
MKASESATYTAALLERKKLCQGTFELHLHRPGGFGFLPGQRILVFSGGEQRDYSLAGSPEEGDLTLCVRQVGGGRVSPVLCSAVVGDRIRFSGPHGYFLFRPSERPAVFVATGTGAAPFASMAKSAVGQFTMIHGVRRVDELYYAGLFRKRAASYVPCLSEPFPPAKGLFAGRVTDYLASRLTAGGYDFYLCGRGEMIRDVTWLVDERFAGSFIYMERFF